MKVNEEMNSKYNTYDHLDKFKCNEDEEILNLEKKFDSFQKIKIMIMLQTQLIQNVVYLI